MPSTSNFLAQTKQPASRKKECDLFDTTEFTDEDFESSAVIEKINGSPKE
jgi:hypothetical protein